jgi:hypothetical protein
MPKESISRWLKASGTGEQDGTCLITYAQMPEESISQPLAEGREENLWKNLESESINI